MTTVTGSYLQYIAVNFQRLHNEYGRVGYVNLMEDHGRSWKHDDCSRSRREMPRRVQNLSRGSRMLDVWPMVVP